MDIEEQVNTIERALGERMISHALAILRPWALELGNDAYIERIAQLQKNYKQVFDYFLVSDAEDREVLLDKLTGEAYRLSDDIYADLRLKRGLSPDLRAFNPENPQSVVRYFASCLRPTEEDYRWLSEIYTDTQRTPIALMAVASIGKNLRECFSTRMMMSLIEAIGSDIVLVSDQAMATSILLLAHYDIRIDFFPDIQNAFVEAISSDDRAYATLAAIVRSTKQNLRELIASGNIQAEDMPEAIRDLMDMIDAKMESDETILSWMPSSENEYMAGIVNLLPDTWVCSVLLGDNEKMWNHLKLTYLSIGKMDMMWDDLAKAEEWLVKRIYSGEATPSDYINYGHCCLLRGDRMVAYENYREARVRCKSAKAFFALFRPDRRALSEHGVPLEQIYLLEDQLIRPE